FANAPLRLTHSAYHQNIAQTQWLPLYLLAVFALVDRPSWRTAAGAAAAAAALVLSNDYGGFIGAVMTPIVVVAYWWAGARASQDWRRLARSAGALAVIGAGAVAAIAAAAPRVLAASGLPAFPASDVARYSARWWAYFVPAVDHPVFGALASSVQARQGVT